MSKTVSGILVAFLIVSTCTAQIVVAPDADLWGGGVTNLSGLAAVPIVQYDPSNGEMWLNTVGLNGVSDTTGNSVYDTVGGDDVGLISLSIPSPAAIYTAPEFDGFYDGIVWNTQYFNGKQQLFSTGHTWLRPTSGIHIWTFDTGLTPADFGTVEMAVNFGTGLPGGTMFGGVQFVPEPSAKVTFLTVALIITGFMRRRSL